MCLPVVLLFSFYISKQNKADIVADPSSAMFLAGDSFTYVCVKTRGTAKRRCTHS